MKGLFRGIGAVIQFVFCAIAVIGLTGLIIGLLIGLAIAV